MANLFFFFWNKWMETVCLFEFACSVKLSVFHVPIKMYYGFRMSLPFTYHFRIKQGLSQNRRGTSRWSKWQRFPESVLSSNSILNSNACAHQIFAQIPVPTSSTKPCIFLSLCSDCQKQVNQIDECSVFFPFLMTLKMCYIHILAYGHQATILRAGW